jgi:hypothetical protein
MLFFIDYFHHLDKSPVDHVQHMLSTNGYNVSKITIVNSKIEITEEGESIQNFDLQVNLQILGIQRQEILHLLKSCKDIKRFIKHVHQELKIER